MRRLLVYFIRSVIFQKNIYSASQIYWISPQNQHHCIDHTTHVKLVKQCFAGFIITKVKIFGNDVYSTAVPQCYQGVSARYYSLSLLQYFQFWIWQFFAHCNNIWKLYYFFWKIIVVDKHIILVDQYLLISNHCVPHTKCQHMNLVSSCKYFCQCYFIWGWYLILHWHALQAIPGGSRIINAIKLNQLLVSEQ